MMSTLEKLALSFLFVNPSLRFGIIDLIWWCFISQLVITKFEFVFAIVLSGYPFILATDESITPNLKQQTSSHPYSNPQQPF